MTYIIFIIIILILFIYCNFYKFKRIIRRMHIKKMKVDDNINDLIDEFKINLKNNTELKTIQNKMRITQIFKYIYYLILVILPMLFLVIYLPYKIAHHADATTIHGLYNMFAFFLFIAVITFLGTIIYSTKNYQKNKKILKEYIYNDFLKHLTYNIKWLDYNPVVSKDTFKLWDTYINWEENYKKANFNKIQPDENTHQNTLLSDFSSSNEIRFEDHLIGVYKEKYIIALSDFSELNVTGTFRKYRHITHEGIFCTVKIDKNILNNIRITNDKKNSFFIEKQYSVTTLPEEFYKNFIILAEDGYKISEKISKKSIEMIENFYDNSKIKFDISIKDNEIFFKFKTLDSMELNSWRNVVDDLMLKEYANIIMFVTTLAEEINNNWK